MFRVGQKVVCIDDHDTELVKRNALYIVSGGYGKYVTLDGVHGVTGRADGMLARRFRPVVERKTDISVFKAMLNNAPATAAPTRAPISANGGTAA